MINIEGLKFVSFEEIYLEQILQIEQNWNPTAWSRQSFLIEAQSSTCYFVIAIYEGQAIGYGALHIIFEEAHITTLAVAQRYQGYGIGKKMLLHLLNFAKKRGAISSTLEVRESNSIARSLYQKMGYIEVRKRTAYYTDNQENAIIMWLNHDPSLF